MMSIEEAIAADSFHPQFDRTIVRGDVEAALAGTDVACVVQGDAMMAGQEHFYLEPHCNFVQPLESDEFLLVASTQVRARFLPCVCSSAQIVKCGRLCSVMQCSSVELGRK